MDVYKNESEWIIQKSQQFCDEQIASNTLENDRKELPIKLLKIRDYLYQIVKSYDQKEFNDQLTTSIFSFSQLLDDLHDYPNEIILLIHSIDQILISEDRHMKIFDYLTDIFFLCQSEKITLNELHLFYNIATFLPFQFWQPLFSNDIVSILIQSISQPSLLLRNLKEDEKSDEVLGLVVDILDTFFCQIESQNDEVFNRYYDYYFNCLIECSKVISSDEDSPIFLLYFLDNLLCTICKQIKQTSQNIMKDSDRAKPLKSIIRTLSDYVQQPSKPDINLVFFNLTKLTTLTNFLNYFDDDFFRAIFGCYMKIENYRFENQKSLVCFISSVACSRNEKAIISMMTVIEQTESFMTMLATHPDVEERVKFCLLCQDLVMSCFYDRKLNEIGNRIINFLYKNNVLYYLCHIALNDDFFNIKVNSAKALAKISAVLPYQFLSDLVLNHHFIEIYFQLVGTEDSFFRIIPVAVRSILDMLDTMPVNNESATLYIKLAKSCLLDEIENCDMTYEDENILYLVNTVLSKAAEQRDRFADF